MTTGEGKSPVQRRQRARVLHGIPIEYEPEGEATKSNAPMFPRSFAAMEGLYARNNIDDLVDRYAGQAVPLDEAFPDAPPPVNPHVALSRPARSALAQEVIPALDPARTRLADRAMVADQVYRQEYQFQMMHRMMMRTGSMAQIATALGVTLDEAYTLRRELLRRMADEAGSIDQLEHTGRTMAFYNEVRGNALRSYDQAEPANHVARQRWLALAMAAENNKHRFLQAIGFYDKFNVTPKEDAAMANLGNDDLELLRNAARNLFNPEATEDAMDRLLDRDSGMDDLGAGGGLDGMSVRVL